MKATLFVIQNDADYTQAKALIEKLMGFYNPEPMRTGGLRPYAAARSGVTSG